MGGGVSMSGNHAHDCAFTISFGDERCDCAGPSDAPEAEPGTLSATARRYLAEARAALARAKP
jgi:hypothetical protein